MNDGTWFNNSAIKQELLQSTIDTLLMVESPPSFPWSSAAFWESF